MSTIREIARELNLSHTTVSRVLNTRNEQTISPATRERVWTAARRMGYHPHTAARALATGRTQRIALLMRYLYSAFHAEVVHEVEQTLRGDGYQLIVATDNWAEHPTDGGSLLHSPGQVDGYLAFENAAHVRNLLSAGAGLGARGPATPVVAMGGHNFGDSLDCAGFDVAAGADRAIRHLIETRRRRIAFVTEERDDPRRVRYHELLRQAGLRPEEIIVPSQRRAPVRETLRGYFASVVGTAMPDALFCFNDEVAIGAYRALRDLDISVGDEIALIGFDDIEDTQYLDTPLTTVRLPIPEMCRLAWELLQRRLSDPEAAPSRTLLQPALIVRQSTIPTIPTLSTRPKTARGSAVAAPEAERP